MFFGDQGGKMAHIICAGGNHNETEQSSRKLSAHRPAEPSAAVEVRGSGCSGQPLCGVMGYFTVSVAFSLLFCGQERELCY